MNLKKIIINLFLIIFAFSSIADEKVLNNQNEELNILLELFILMIMEKKLI